MDSLWPAFFLEFADSKERVLRYSLDRFRASS